MTTVFKIRSKKTGLFSKGGSSPSEWTWSKTGKVWKTIGQLRCHLAQHGSYASHGSFGSQNPCQEYLDNEAEVVEYEIVEKNVTPIENFKLRKDL